MKIEGIKNKILFFLNLATFFLNESSTNAAIKTTPPKIDTSACEKGNTITKHKMEIKNQVNSNFSGRSFIIQNLF